MNYDNGGLSPSDVALIQSRGNNGGGFGGFGGDGAWWIVLFLIFALGGFNGNGGFGNSGGGFGGGGFSGGFNDNYAWLSNGQKEIMQNTNNGFNTLQLGNQLTSISDSVQGLSTQLCNCCADMSQTVNAGFANAETAANARQMADMQQNFNNQIATLQGFNNVSQGFNQLGSQMASCCCDIREGIAGVNYNNAIQTNQLQAQIASENCADRAALQEGVRDIIQNQTFSTQRILDQLCNDNIDAKNEKIADLERQLTMADLRASQTAQNAFIAQGFSNEVDQLYNRLNSCPVPTTPVYRKNSDIQLQQQWLWMQWQW